MAILIEGMEMPQNCQSCNFYNGLGCKATGMMFSMFYNVATRRGDCPLIEVPEPHGDLIDREELQHIIGQFSLNWEYGEGVSDCWDALLNASTVIPASEEG